MHTLVGTRLSGEGKIRGKKKGEENKEGRSWQRHRKILYDYCCYLV